MFWWIHDYHNNVKIVLRELYFWFIFGKNKDQNYANIKIEKL